MSSQRRHLTVVSVVPRNQTPRVAERGAAGESFTYTVELRTMADVGLVSSEQGADGHRSPLSATAVGADGSGPMPPPQLAIAESMLI